MAASARKKRSTRRRIRVGADGAPEVELLMRATHDGLDNDTKCIPAVNARTRKGCLASKDSGRPHRCWIPHEMLAKSGDLVCEFLISGPSQEPLQFGVMVASVDGVVAAALLRGAAGVRDYLRDNRQSLNELFEGLASPALLDAPSSSHDASSPKFGLQIDALPLGVQRELWSAFIKWRTTLPAVELEGLVSRFLSLSDKENHSADPVCIHLAKMLHEEMVENEYHDSSLLRMAVQDTIVDHVDDTLAKLVYVPKPSRAASLPRSEDFMTKKRRRSADMDVDETNSYSQSGETQDLRSTQPKTVTLASETETRMNGIGVNLAQLGSSDVSTDQMSKTSELVIAAVDLLRQVMNDIHATQQDNEALFNLACTKLQLRTTSDETLFQVTNGLMEANWSSRYAAIYLETTLLPRILSARSVISRVLVQAVLLYAKPAYGLVLVDGLLVPLITAPSIGVYQGEAVTRLLREKCVPSDQLDGMLRRALEIRTSELLTNEATVLVFQNVLNMKPALSAATIDLLASAITSAVEQEASRESLLKSAKFASLLFTLVSKYTPICRPHVEEFSNVASRLTSTMGKSALRALQKLKN